MTARTDAVGTAHATGELRRAGGAMPHALKRTEPVTTGRTGDLALAARQVAYEQRAFWRNRTRAFFSFGMPIMLLVLFASLNSGGRIAELGNIRYVVFFLPGILAYGIIITQFVNMAAGLAIQRDNGLLKRMRGTPLPGWAYVGGRVASTALTSLLMAAVMLVVGRFAFDVHLRAEAVPAVVVAVLLGAATFAALGMAAVSIIPNAEAAPVVANVLILPLSFISGIWYPLTGAPDWLRKVAEILPVERLADALHHAFDPLNHGSAFAGTDLLWLAIWLVIGVRLAMRFWRRETAR
jgi:ABC-2 type transport system permease protein